MPDLENRQLASREHKVGIKWNITRHEKNKDLPSFIHEPRRNTKEKLKREIQFLDVLASPEPGTLSISST